MNIVNKSTVYNANVFNETLNRNYLALISSSSSSSSKTKLPRRPLITYCNHTSCMDDPLIWGSLMPFNWLLNSNRIRWTSAAAEICFISPIYTTFFALGKTFPMIRGDGNQFFSKSEFFKRKFIFYFFPKKIYRNISTSNELCFKINARW